MILPAPLARMIARDEKTEHRVPVRESRPVRRRGGSHRPAVPWRPYAGSVYAIFPGRGQAPVCYVRAVEVRREPLSRMTDQDGRREGFPDLAAFADDWMRARDRRYPPLIDSECEYCDDQNIVPNPEHDPADPESEEWLECPHCDFGTVKVPAELTDQEILDLFDRQHGHTLVWVIALERTAQRFLAAPPPAPRPWKDGTLPPGDPEEDRGYTTDSALAIDELEAVDDLELSRQRREADNRRSAFDHRRWAEARAARAELTIDDRIRLCRDAARRNGIDVRPQLAKVRRLRARGRSQAAILQELQAAERAANREAA